MLIRKLNQNTFDVFGDVGFDNWTRIKRFHWGFKPVAGVFLARPVLREVAAAIEAHPEGSIENV